MAQAAAPAAHSSNAPAQRLASSCALAECSHLLAGQHAQRVQAGNAAAAEAASPAAGLAQHQLRLKNRLIAELRAHKRQLAGASSPRMHCPWSTIHSAGFLRPV